MKKHHLLALTGLLLFAMSFTPLARHSASATAPSTPVRTPSANDWGEWINDDCFKGIDFRVKKGEYNSYAKKWYWYVQFRNRYNNEVNYSYSVSEPGTMTNPDHRDRMASNNVSDSKGFLMYSGDKIHVRVGYIRFGSNDSGGYANCDQ